MESEHRTNRAVAVGAGVTALWWAGLGASVTGTSVPLLWLPGSGLVQSVLWATVIGPVYIATVVAIAGIGSGRLRSRTVPARLEGYRSEGSTAWAERKSDTGLVDRYADPAISTPIDIAVDDPDSVDAPAVLVLDPSGAVVFATPSAAAVLGRPVEEIVGEAFGWVVAEHDTEVRILTADGEHRAVRLRAVESRWSEDTGHVVAIVAAAA